MYVELRFPGGFRIDGSTGGFTVRTDQPESKGGNSSAPTPFQLFVVSLATCAGYYVLAFLRERGLSSEGLGLRLKTASVPGGDLLSAVLVEIELPAGFPDRYRGAIERAAAACLVKRQFEQPPTFTIRTVAAPLPVESAA
jgi:ribosomal protein S12 methylthiotransferase accessory factor